jgi:hypothetical protein
MNSICAWAIAATASVVKRKAPGRTVFRDDFFQARLEDRNLAGLQPGDLGRVDIDADDVVADFGETGTGDQANIARAEYCDVHMSVICREIRASARNAHCSGRRVARPRWENVGTDQPQNPFALSAGRRPKSKGCRGASTSLATRATPVLSIVEGLSANGPDDSAS